MDQDLERKGPQHQSNLIKRAYEHLKICSADILYIQSESGLHRKFHFPGKKNIWTSPLLKVLGCRPPKDQFAQVHKSYIVIHYNWERSRANTLQIEKVSGQTVYSLNQEKNIYLVGRGPYYRKNLLEKYLKIKGIGIIGLMRANFISRPTKQKMSPIYSFIF